MAKTTKNSERGGRPTDVSKQAQLAALLGFVLEAYSRNVPFIETSELREHLRKSGPEVGESRMRTLLAELGEFIQILSVGSDGVHISTTNRGSHYFESLFVDVREKRAIANKVAQDFPRNVVVAAGAGTTVAMTMKQIGSLGRYLNVVSNSIGVADSLLHLPSVTLDIIGGEYNSKIHATIGRDIVQYYADRKVAYSIIGLSGMTEEGGLAVRHKPEVEILQQMISSTTDRVYLVATARKLAQRDLHTFATIEEIQKTCKVSIYTNPLSSLKSDPAVLSAAQPVFKKFDQLIITAT
jgi:DeoR/GlpR family transcriptional regulator of sugar metabolism